MKSPTKIFITQKTVLLDRYVYSGDPKYVLIKKFNSIYSIICLTIIVHTSKN